MPTSVQAHLLFGGHACQLGSVTSLTEVWISHNLRPDLPDNEYLPDIGDTPISTNLISAQTVLAGKLDSIFVKTIQEQEYLEGKERGTIYTVQYDDQPFQSVGDPTNDENTIIMSISSGAQVDTYSRDPNDNALPKIWVKIGGEAKEYKNAVITKISCLTNVNTTRRYRGLTRTEVLALGTLAGNTNSSVMWGQPIGNILYNGIQAAPVSEQTTPTAGRQINWNVSNSYTIKYIPGVTDNSWNHVFVQGEYTRLYKDQGMTQTMDNYPKATLPDDLT
jgi:hypothetical protein